MKAKRTALLGILVCLTGATAFGQTALNNVGDIGLFTMPTADNPRAGQLSLGFYGWKEQLVAGDLPSDPPWQSRLYNHWAGEASLNLGLTDWMSVFVSAGGERYESRGGWRGGVVNGIQIFDRFAVDEGRKVRIGTKFNFHAEHDPDLRVAVWTSVHIPVGNATVRQDEQNEVTDVINSRRTDWEMGAVLTKSIWTGILSYQLSGRHDFDIRAANRFRVGLGVDIPLFEYLHIIGELDRTILDGGDFAEEHYSLLYNGVRFWLGRTGLAFSAAINANVDMLLHDGFSPSPIGGLIGVTYAKWPPPPPVPVVAPAPAPPVTVVEETVTTTPPPPAPRTTVDEIYFDEGSARLTNIAKAILDGVALRMKNDLNSTALITGYSDNTGSEEANLAISARRAEAAKEYLVTRHGIDPNRISAAAKGSADPAYDNATAEGRAKNRRAVIIVTLVSGT